jgi:hypothetical protein
MADPHVRSVPLTVAQRARLLAGCLPVAFFSVATVAYLTLLRSVYPVKIQLLAFLALVLSVTRYYAVQRLRDLVAGTALVDEDVLENVLGRGPQSRRRRRPQGQFSRLGRLTLTMPAFHRAERGRRHRLIYSPASRIVWSAEPLPDGSAG